MPQGVRATAQPWTTAEGYHGAPEPERPAQPPWEPRVPPLTSEVMWAKSASLCSHFSDAGDTGPVSGFLQGVE